MISAASHASLPSKPPPPTERETRFWLFLGTALASEEQRSLLALRASLDRNPGGLVHRMGTDDAHPMHLPVIVDWVEATLGSAAAAKVDAFARAAARKAARRQLRKRAAKANGSSSLAVGDPTRYESHAATLRFMFLAMAAFEEEQEEQGPADGLADMDADDLGGDCPREAMDDAYGDQEGRGDAAAHDFASEVRVPQDLAGFLGDEKMERCMSDLNIIWQVPTNNAASAAGAAPIDASVGDAAGEAWGCKEPALLQTKYVYSDGVIRSVVVDRIGGSAPPSDATLRAALRNSLALKLLQHWQMCCHAGCPMCEKVGPGGDSDSHQRRGGNSYGNGGGLSSQQQQSLRQQGPAFAQQQEGPTFASASLAGSSFPRPSADTRGFARVDARTWGVKLLAIRSCLPPRPPAPGRGHNRAFARGERSIAGQISPAQLEAQYAAKPQYRTHAAILKLVFLALDKIHRVGGIVNLGGSFTRDDVPAEMVPGLTQAPGSDAGAVPFLDLDVRCEEVHSALCHIAQCPFKTKKVHFTQGGGGRGGGGGGDSKGSIDNSIDNSDRDGESKQQQQQQQQQQQGPKQPGRWQQGPVPLGQGSHYSQHRHQHDDRCCSGAASRRIDCDVYLKTRTRLVCNSLTRKLLEHWIDCAHVGCPICQPLGQLNEAKRTYTFPLVDTFHTGWTPLLRDQKQRMLVVRKRRKARNHGGAGAGIGMGKEAARPIMKRSRAISSSSSNSNSSGGIAAGGSPQRSGRSRTNSSGSALVESMKRVCLRDHI